jgi:hypothetical protein
MSLMKKAVVLVALSIAGSALVVVGHGQRQAKQKNAEVIASLQSFVEQHHKDPAAKTQIEVAQVLIDCQSSWNASVDKCGKTLVDRYGQDVVGHLIAINAAGGFGMASKPTQPDTGNAPAGDPQPSALRVAAPDTAPTGHGYRLGDGQNGQ